MQTAKVKTIKIELEDGSYHEIPKGFVCIIDELNDRLHVVTHRMSESDFMKTFIEMGISLRKQYMELKGDT